MLKVFGMWFVGFIYFMVAVEVNDFFPHYHGIFETFMWTAALLPIRWDRHMPKNVVTESWADKHDTLA